eukprot:3083868-Rhodomonas_salina.1
MWVSDSALLCQSASGVGETVRVSMTAGGSVGSMTEAVSFDSSSVSVAMVVNRPATGSTSVTLSGSGFGSSLSSTFVRSGSSSCEASVWVSASSMMCRASSGYGATFGLSLTAGAQAGSLSSVISYDGGASLSAVGLVNVAMAGQAVSLTGSNLGITGQSVHGRTGFTVSEASLWLSETSVECRSPSGLSHSTKLAFTVSSLVGSTTELLSYDANIISSTERANFAHGSSSLTVHGTGFGIVSTTGQVRSGMSACEATSWISHTTIQCHSSQGLLLRSRSIVVTSGLTTGSISEAWSFDSVRVSALLPANQLTTAGLQLNYTSVSHFTAGTFDRSAAVRIGGSSCEASAWTSETSILCRYASGIGASATLVVTGSTQIGSLSTSVSYNTPSMSLSNETNIRLTGSNSVTVSGTSFATHLYSVGARSGMTAAEATSWHSDTTVSCLIGRSLTGAGGSRALAITAQNVIGSVTELLSYNLVQVSSMARSNLPAMEQTAQTLAVSNLMPLQSSVASRIGQTATQSTVWQSETTIVALTMTEGGRSLQVLLTTGSQTASMTSSVSFDRVTLSSVGISNSPAVGKEFLSLSSAGWGLHTVAMSVGATACEATVWQSFTSARCRSSDGVDRTLRFSLTAASDVASVTEAVSYDYALASSMRPANVPLSGYASMTVSGQHLVTADISASVRLEVTACAVTTWVSDSSLSCLVSFAKYWSAAASGVVITQVGQSSSMSALFSYDDRSSKFYTSRSAENLDLGFELLPSSPALEFGSLQVQYQHTAKPDVEVWDETSLGSSPSSTTMNLVDGSVMDTSPWFSSTSGGEEFVRLGASNVYKSVPVHTGIADGSAFAVFWIAPHGGFFELEKINLIWGDRASFPSDIT